MRAFLRFVFSTVLLSSLLAAQGIRLAAHYSVVKAENGLILGWQVASEDRAARQIDVYSEEGRLLTSLSPLKLVPEAKRSTVHDVSALPGHIIAAAVVYRKGEDSVPAGTLIYFDFHGNVLLALATAPSREVHRLTVDSESNVWTLTEGAGEEKPSKAPMVVAYSSSGKVLREMFRRSEFPVHAAQTQENDDLGVTGIGSSSGRIWFWLPGSTELVAFNSDGTSLDRTITGLPQQAPHEAPIKIVLGANGDLLVQLVGSQEAHRAGQINLFSRSKTGKRWELVNPPEPGTILIGVDGERALFARGDGDGTLVYYAPLM